MLGTVLIVVCSITTVLALLVYLGYRYLVNCGLHYKVKFSEKDYPLDESLFLYKYGKGTHNNVGAVFSELKRIVPELRTIGIYYDDKTKVKPEVSRWAVGAIVAEGRETVPDPVTVMKLMNWGYKRHRLPTAKRTIQTKCPHKNFISILLTYSEVWRSLDRFYKKHPKFPKTDVWMDIFANKEATYLGLLDKQLDGFFVLEATENDNTDAVNEKKND